MNAILDRALSELNSDLVDLIVEECNSMAPDHEPGTRIRDTFEQIFQDFETEAGIWEVPITGKDFSITFTTVLKETLVWVCDELLEESIEEHESAMNESHPSLTAAERNR